MDVCPSMKRIDFMRQLPVWMGALFMCALTSVHVTVADETTTKYVVLQAEQNAGSGQVVDSPGALNGKAVVNARP